MAIKTYSGAAGVEAGVPNTKLRAEQMKSEDGFTSLAVDLEALRGQVKDIIGAADYKEEITGEYAKVQIVDLAAHLDASGASSLSVKQAANVVGGFAVNTNKLTVAAATGNTAIKGTLDVDMQATLASANVEDLTSGRIVVAGALGELGDFSGLTFVGGELTAASATVSDLTATRVVYAGASGSLVDSSEMTFGAGGLTLVKDVTARSGSFSGDMTVMGDLFVNGNTVTVDVGTLTIEDKNIVIAKGATGATLDGAGIFLGSEAGESLQWNHADTKWVASDRFMADEFQGDNLTAARLTFSDANKVIQSVAALSSWVTGTINQISIADDGDGSITLSLPQNIHTDADVEFDSLKLGDNLADAGKALKIGAAGEVIAAAWNEFVAIEANVGLELIQSGFKAEIGLAQDIRSSASPEFAALNLGAYGDLLAAGSDFKVSAAAKLFSADGAFGGAAGGTWATGFALSKDAASWDALWNAYSMGSKGQLSLVEILTAASPTTTKRLVLVKTMASAGPDMIVGAGDLAELPTGAASYQNGKADIFVNGQKQVEGASADFEFAAATGADKVKVAFKYNLQIGDVVELIRYPAAAK